MIGNLEHEHKPEHRKDFNDDTGQAGSQHQPLHENHQPGSHTHDFRSFERKRLLIAIILTTLMMAAETVGGIISGSLALLSDAGHMFTHSFALLVSFFAIIYSNRPATKEKSFGFYRAEILAALFNGITLLIITGFILWEAYKRILNPRPVAETEMFIIAVLGLAVNIATALILWRASKKSLNIRSAFVHMIGDAASSVGVVIGAVIIYFTGFYIIDPILSIIIAILILVWAILLIRDSVRILMESTPRSINTNSLIENLIKSDSSIKGVHDLHVWEITTGMYCMTAHIIVEDMSISRTGKLLENMQVFLQQEYNIQHPIIQFESFPGFSHGCTCNLDKNNPS